MNSKWRNDCLSWIQAPFSVWSQGATIELDPYIAFCAAYPDISYYVNVDVIPGIMGVKSSLTKESIEASCKQGWINYRRMIQSLPKDKVIPVFHQNDDIRWLDKYLAFGVKYIGISPANDESTGGKMKWLKSIRNRLFDGAGRQTVNTHGFAVTSYRLMKSQQWTSVDSASWKGAATWGGIFVPVERRGEFCYSEPPLLIGTTPQSSNKRAQHHWDSLTPGLRTRTMAYLESCGLKLGKWEPVQKDGEYKLDTSRGEIWLNKKKRVMMRILEQGVNNSFESRAIATAKFVARSNKVLPIKDILLAGQVMPYPLEFQIRRRLLSYHYTGRTPSGIKYIEEHTRLIQEGL